jgi:hypothetical protein
MSARGAELLDRLQLGAGGPAILGLKFEREDLTAMDRMTSGTPARTPRPFRIFASMGERPPPLAGWKAKIPGALRRRRCSNTAR